MERLNFMKICNTFFENRETKHSLQNYPSFYYSREKLEPQNSLSVHSEIWRESLALGQVWVRVPMVIPSEAT